MKRPYSPPQLTRHGEFENLPQGLQAAAQELFRKATPITTVAARDHRWVSVSESFATLLGYPSVELVGKKVDDFTSRGSIDVEFAFDTCFRIGEGEGIWLFNRSNGSRVFVNYHVRIENEHSFAQIRPLLITETWASDGSRIPQL